MTRERVRPFPTSSPTWKTYWRGYPNGGNSQIRPRVSFLYQCKMLPGHSTSSKGGAWQYLQAADTVGGTLGTRGHRRIGWGRRCGIGIIGFPQWRGWCSVTHRLLTQACRSPSNSSGLLWSTPLRAYGTTSIQWKSHSGRNVSQKSSKRSIPTCYYRQSQACRSIIMYLPSQIQPRPPSKTGRDHAWSLDTLTQT